MTILNTQVSGDGQPTLVFVHGYACSLEDWDRQVAGLSASFRCLAVDLPGHGCSPLPRTATIAALAADLNDALHSVVGPMILIGHSMGAKIIREAYCQSPHRIAGLILIDGALYDGDTEQALVRARAAIEPQGFSTYLRRHFQDMCPPHWAAAQCARVVERAVALEPSFAHDLYLSAVKFDPVRSLETLQQIAVPVLVMQATHFDVGGRRIPMQVGMNTPLIDAVTRLVRDSEVTIIESASHFVMADAADRVSTAIRYFAMRVSRGA